jgi:hypothetical protein
MYSPNNNGLNGQPCFTPIVHGNVLERPSVGCDTHAWSWLYMDCMHVSKRPPTPMPSSTRHSFSRDTILKNLAIFWQLVGTYCLNMKISEILSSKKSGDLGAFFSQKS